MKAEENMKKTEAQESMGTNQMEEMLAVYGVLASIARCGIVTETYLNEEAKRIGVNRNCRDEHVRNWLIKEAEKICGFKLPISNL